MADKKIDGTQKNTAGSCPPATCFLIWDENNRYDFRSSLFKGYAYEMKCNRCLSFIGVTGKPSKISANYCSNCGAKIIKIDDLYSSV